MQSIFKLLQNFVDLILDALMPGALVYATLFMSLKQETPFTFIKNVELNMIRQIGGKSTPSNKIIGKLAADVTILEVQSISPMDDLPML